MRGLTRKELYIAELTWGGIPLLNGEPDVEYIRNSHLFKRNSRFIHGDQYWNPGCRQADLDIPNESIHVDKVFPTKWISKTGEEYTYYNSNYKLQGDRYAPIESITNYNGETVHPLPKDGYPYKLI